MGQADAGARGALQQGFAGFDDKRLVRLRIWMR